MRPVTPLRDPAPSRLSYRMQRLLLTPALRRLLVFGVPIAVLMGAGSAYFADQSRRDAIALSIAEFRQSIEERPEFMVHIMAIDGATDAVSEDIREVVPIEFPVSSFDLDLPAIKAKVKELDAVATAVVRIRAGGILQIDIEERIPAVVWRSTAGLELLDASGHRVAQLGDRTERADLPLLAGTGAERAVPEALALLTAVAPIESRVRGLLRVGERRWDVVLDRDQRILLPEEDPIDALERILAMNEARDLLERDVLVVDLRLPRRPTLRLADGAVSELRRIRATPTGATTQ